jgi:hypothetical protein
MFEFLSGYFDSIQPKQNANQMREMMLIYAVSFLAFLLCGGSTHPNTTLILKVNQFYISTYVNLKSIYPKTL